MLDKPTSWRRWSTADREPVAKWGTKRITLVGDAAHPVAQYMAQGACMALEDAVTLGKALAQCEGDAAQAFALYESVRIPRTARIVWSTREMGRVYHAAGVERQYVTCCGKGNRRQSFTAAWSGCTAGKKITVCNHAEYFNPLTIGANIAPHFFAGDDMRVLLAPMEGYLTLWCVNC